MVWTLSAEFGQISEGATPDRLATAASTTIAFWCRCLRVNISDQKFATIDEFCEKTARRLPIRQVVRDMANIPPGFSV